MAGQTSLRINDPEQSVGWWESCTPLPSCMEERVRAVHARLESGANAHIGVRSNRCTRKRPPTPSTAMHLVIERNEQRVRRRPGCRGFLLLSLRLLLLLEGRRRSCCECAGFDR